MVQNILWFSLVLIIVLFLIQSIRLRSRDRQAQILMQKMHEKEKQAGFGRMLTGIAHDLGTPLGALGCAWQTRRKALDKLRLLIQCEENSISDSEGVCKILKALDNTDGVLDESLERSLEMVKFLRKAGRGEPEGPRVVAAAEVMDGVLRLLDYQLKSGIKVTNELDPEFKVLVQPGELGRVFINLLVNAHEAMAGAGEIRIASRTDQGNLYISVGDNGPGLPENSAGSLFSSGWTTKGPDAGSGLGLYISREIMSGFGGGITAENNPGGGAEMTVWLPLVTGDNQ